MSASKVLRLVTLINRELRELCQSGRPEDSLRGFQTLSARIRAANPPEKKWRIDRKKLQRITEHDEYLKLTISQWIALDRYFSSQGISFSNMPLFERNILEPLADCGHVCFILGSVRSERDHRNNVRAWDCRSMAILLQEIAKTGNPIELEIQDILLDETFNIALLENEAWFQYLNKPGCSVVSIGSPRICVASEILLAEMFRLPRFKSNPMCPLPFRFIWNEKSLPYESSVSLSPEHLPRPYRALATSVLRNESDALMVGPDVHGFPRIPTNSKCPAVIVAQRRSGRGVWMVVAGLSGPGTFGAAEFISNQVTDSLPLASERGQHGPVLWGVAMIPVRGKPPGRGDTRSVGKATWLVPLTEWRLN